MQQNFYEVWLHWIHMFHGMIIMMVKDMGSAEIFIQLLNYHSTKTIIWQNDI